MEGTLRIDSHVSLKEASNRSIGITAGSAICKTPQMDKAIPAWGCCAPGWLSQSGRFMSTSR